MARTKKKTNPQKPIKNFVEVIDDNKKEENLERRLKGKLWVVIPFTLLIISLVVGIEYYVEKQLLQNQGQMSILAQAEQTGSISKEEFNDLENLNKLQVIGEYGQGNDLVEEDAMNTLYQEEEMLPLAVERVALSLIDRGKTVESLAYLEKMNVQDAILDLITAELILIQTPNDKAKILKYYKRARDKAQTKNFQMIIDAKIIKINKNNNPEGK